MKKGTEIKTWEDVCEALNIDPVASLAWATALPEADQKPVVAFFKLTKLSKALYDGKQPDWKNYDERKYWPYFDMDSESDSSGFGFAYVGFDCWGTITAVGSRICYPSAELARHAGIQFADWYQDMMVLPN